MSAPAALRAWIAALVSAALAYASSTGAGDEKFQRAYYLETHECDYAAAAALYAEVIASTSDAALKAEAMQRREACAEELACFDLARLMPASAIAYVEIDRPGEQVNRLLAGLGLLKSGSAASDAAGDLGVSPQLAASLLGIRGVAVAVTGFDPAAQAPAGVAILHPGKHELLRAIVESALPLGCEPEPPIDGCETYGIGGQVLIAVTRRLIVVSSQREEIEGVLARLRDTSDKGLTGEPVFAEQLARRSGSLLFAVVNFKPILPLAQLGLAAAATGEPELAALPQLLDIGSLRSVSLALSVGEGSLTADARLTLEKGHRNLAFHFLRLPAVDASLLRRVPAGAAAAVTFAFGDARGAVPPRDSATGAAEPISALDIGREVFANVVGVAAFTMPSASEKIRVDHVPDAALVMSVRDVARSTALWTELLGVSGVVGRRATSIEGQSIDMDGVSVRRFALPDDVVVYFASTEQHVILSLSRAGIAAALGTFRGAKSALDDGELASAMERVGSSTVIAAVGHAGRLMQLAKVYASPRELEPMEQFVSAAKSTTAALTIDHSSNELAISLRVTGLPRLGGMLAKVLEETRGEFRRELRSESMLSGR